MDVLMLGRMSISVEEHRVPLTFGSRGRLLAGYLFQFPDRPHRREFLTDAFWQESPEQQARAAMNTALWRLRKVLALDSRDPKGKCLRSSGDEIVLERKPWMRIDTHLFDETARPALGGSEVRDDARRVVILEQAVAQYRGAFLEGDDADWVITERERLHSLYVRCLCELMRMQADRGELEAAISAGRRVLAVDPFRETVMRAVVILLFLNGQRVQAIDELTRWQLALRKQVGVSPMPETLELRSALMSGAICDDVDGWRLRHLATPAAVRDSVMIAR